MILSQGFEISEDNELVIPEGTEIRMSVPEELFPVCPVCGEAMTMNLRADETFAEDRGWHEAAGRYQDYLRRHQNMKTLFLELGVGFNTPVIIKLPFIQMTESRKDAVYACLNYGEACTAEVIKDKSICINGDIREILTRISNVNE